jgi:hypothetical protein
MLDYLLDRAPIALAGLALVCSWLLLVRLWFLHTVANKSCPDCGSVFGWEAAAKAPGYYSRLYGPDTCVRGRPPWVNARAVRCSVCQAEFVFSITGRYLKRFASHGEDRC